jgi:MFS family permease
VVALCSGGLAASLTQTMVIPIQGELPRLLGSTASSTAWVVTITLLAAAVTMPVMGRLADIVGKQRVLVVSAVLLVAGSVVCALSDSLAPMLVGRALQGLAMGYIPVGIALLRQVVPPRLAGSAIAAMSATLGVGGAIGLPLSAWIVQVGDWHVLFWVAAGLGAAVLTSTPRPPASTSAARSASRWASSSSSSESPRPASGAGPRVAPSASLSSDCSCWSPGAPSSCAPPSRSSTCAPPPASPCCSPTSRPWRSAWG